MGDDETTIVDDISVMGILIGMLLLISGPLIFLFGYRMEIINTIAGLLFWIGGGLYLIGTAIYLLAMDWPGGTALFMFGAGLFLILFVNLFGPEPDVGANEQRIPKESTKDVEKRIERDRLGRPQTKIVESRNER